MAPRGCWWHPPMSRACAKLLADSWMSECYASPSVRLGACASSSITSYPGVQISLRRSFAADWSSLIDYLAAFWCLEVGRIIGRIRQPAGIR